MKPELRVVTQIPLEELWDRHGSLASSLIRHLDQDDVKQLLRDGPVHFVIADCGLALKWIPTTERFAFWKKIHLQVTQPGQPIFLDRFPGSTAYIASLWDGRDDAAVVLLERYH